MKIKITKKEVKKKSTKVANVKHSDSLSYRVFSLTLKQENKSQTIFI